jgi:alpha-D-xyloside xylohydrolase
MTDTRLDPSRRRLLQSAAAWVALPAVAHGADGGEGGREVELTVPQGMLRVTALSERAVRVRVVPGAGAGAPVPQSLTLVPGRPGPQWVKSVRGDVTSWRLPFMSVEFDARTHGLRFLDRAGRLLLAEQAGTRRLVPSRLGDEAVHLAEQGFDAPADERLYGTGCFQDGMLDLRGLPRRLTQVNTQISLPFVLSSRGYGLLWHQTGMSELNPPGQALALRKTLVDGKAQVAEVTTTVGNAQVVRRMATFEGSFTTEAAGRFAFLLDVGKAMGSRHHVEIDGQVRVSMANHWLPPTVGFVTDLAAGEHHVKVLANDDDAPVLHHGPMPDRTLWRSPVADAVDYVVIAGPSAADVMSGYRAISGSTPMLPRWAYGYIHCRERFNSSAEILETTREFRRRGLPVDLMVQDWQYWGRHGWNAMRFDEEHYPDPAALVRELHDLHARLMLSVWARIGRETELGRACAALGHYIPGTEWVDFFDRRATEFYTRNQNERLGSFGIDAWWQDATEPENDDLVGRHTAAGAGERVRLAYPWHVTHAVYESQRQASPDRRVMLLTRSAFPGQHRHAAATWSGDIGDDWDTLKRQIPAGLNMAAAGYAYWTVDAGGFFRPGEAQYTDKGYHERLLRWFQYATFLPLQRVHGYMSRTEFWHYGEEVEAQARHFLELRYRLHPYIYGLAADVTRKGLPMMRPLVFDFAQDGQALDQRHSYMFGPALHVAPVYEPGVQAWPVYLPQTPGGWVDFWTGERRQGGRTHEVPAPLSRIPLHLRAGSILPLGPVVQSTADFTGEALDLWVVPGADGKYELYEDAGLDDGYERGASSVIAITWNDRDGVLRLAARAGRFPGMLSTRRFVVHRVQAGGMPLQGAEGVSIVYDGRALAVRLPPSSPPSPNVS